MSKLSVDQKTVKDLFSGKHADFLIPDYQRPYAWGHDECETLWEDLFAFAFPNDNCEDFKSDTDEYYLGPIVTFRNEAGKLEIIDGQQRLTTLLLLLRAFYDKFSRMQDKPSRQMRKNIAECVWRTDEFDEPDTSKLKIDSEVASDADKEEFLRILRTGEAPKQNKSAYANNFRFFREKIDDLVSTYPTYTPYLATRILNNAILLPIEAESQDTALRIFSTLNDRGRPLSDADIFKSQFYKYFSELGRKDDFIKEWKALEEMTKDIFGSRRMDELFARYMYFERARHKIKETTTKALRDFYGQNSYALLKSEKTFEDLKSLAIFWDKIVRQDSAFSQRVLDRLFVLNYAPNGMWTYFVSVYFLAKRDENDQLEESAFFAFLNRITAFIFAYAVDRPGVNALRGPVYAEMINLVYNQEVTFKDYRFERENIRQQLQMYKFTNQRPITKSLLMWWAFNNPSQKVFDLNTWLEIEHIYPKRRAKEIPLTREDNLEALGNKAILESRINIRASDYRFSDKKRYYLGFTTDGGLVRERTNNAELLELANTIEDFNEADIEERTKRIIDSFVDFLEANSLIK